MSNQVEIVGYEQHGNCEHCRRPLKHCIRISDGRIVGATCFDKKLTKPRVYQGKSYRFGSEHIVRIAKVVQFVPPHRWSTYGVNEQSARFEAAL